MPIDLILPLSSPNATLQRAGGKGANLAILARAGFDVPPGFIVATDAYRAFVQANAIGPRLLDLARSVSPDDPAALEATSQSIRALFAAGTVPAGIAEAIRAAYATLPPLDPGPSPSSSPLCPRSPLGGAAGTGLLYCPDHREGGIDDSPRSEAEWEGGPGSAAPAAVRSSATAEDLPGLSFAGQQDTYLNVIGPDAVLEAVKLCWGSLWTARAMGYRARNHISPDDVALAVVVQAMIPADVSGILFTADPVTGHRGETVIDASFGLGEAIVSGQVEPDHYVVGPRERRIISSRIGAKAVATMSRPAGGTESVPIDASGRAARQALPDTQILELADVAARIAEEFGSPQDVEWAWAGGRLYVLQSRPITSLYPLPDSVLHSDHLRVLFSLNSVQGMVEPFTPLGLDIFPLVLGGFLTGLGIRRPVTEVLVPAGRRLYIDVTTPATDARLRRVLLSALSVGDPAARQALLQLVESGRIPITSVTPRRSFARLLFHMLPILARFPLTWLRPEARRRAAIDKAERFIAQMRQTMAAAPSLAARLALMEKYLPLTIPKFIPIVGPVMVPALMSQILVDRWLVAWAGAKPGSVLPLLRGPEGNPTTEMDLKLWAAAQAIRQDAASLAAFRGEGCADAGVPAEALARAYLAGELPAAAQQALRAFLDAYGMRGAGEIDIERPRWREDPRAIIQTLCSYLQIDDPELAPDRVFAAGRAEAERLAAEHVARVRAKRGRLRARLLAATIRRMRLLGGMREIPKFEMVKFFDVLRAVLLVSGRDLVEQGRLDQAGDIFFVPLSTLRAAATDDSVDLRAIASEGRAGYSRELARRQIPRLLLSTGEAFYQGLGQAGAGELIGIGVSPGVAEGLVRVIEDPRGARLEPGEILVCPATDPGWTPLFLSAGGLVMELGGTITHGAVVAREYGIPAVVGVHDATRRLKTGQRIRVDGSAGRVIIVD